MGALVCVESPRGKAKYKTLTSSRYEKIWEINYPNGGW